METKYIKNHHYSYTKNKQKPQRENIYNGTWESNLLFKAMSNLLELNKKTLKWNKTLQHKHM